MQKNRVRFLSGKDTLEKDMATHSSSLVWRIPWTEERGGLPSWSRKEMDMTELIFFFFYRQDIIGSSHYPLKQILFLDPFHRGVN